MIMFKSYEVTLITLIKRRRIVLAGTIFSLHTKFTAVLLIVFCALLTSKELVIEKGKPITCDVTPKAAKDVQGLKKVIESYCWIQKTFLVPPTLTNASRLFAHPGLTNHQGIRDYKIKYYSYYQWVTFALFFQGWFCYLPWALWKRWENGLMRIIVMGLHLGARKKEVNEKEQKTLVEYLIKHLNFHTKYAAGYWICELICFFGIVSQAVLMNWFFDGEFMNYGLNILGLFELDDADPQTRFDPFIFIFPRVTKCIFRFFGPTKTIQIYDVLCVLNLNNTNEKIYIFIWFWYTILLALSVTLFIYRVMMLLFPKFRQFLLHSQNRMVSAETAEVISRISVCDWWIFHMLGENVDPVLFSQVATEFAKQHKALMSGSKETETFCKIPPLSLDPSPVLLTC